MSDAPDSTFSAGETKLLISIIKNLTGDLQVCFCLGASTLRVLLFHISRFYHRVEANAYILLRFFTYPFSFWTCLFESRFLLPVLHLHHYFLPFFLYSICT